MANVFGSVKPQYDGDNKKRTISHAQVTVKGGQVQITYLPKEDWEKKDGSMIEITHPNGKVTDFFPMNKVPRVLEEGFDEILVVTHDEEAGITSFAPWEGVFKCTFEALSRPNGENTPPIWKESKPKTFKEKSGKDKVYITRDFRAYYVISQNPFFKGVKLTRFLQYLFAENPANGLTAFTFQLASPTRAKQSVNGQKLLDCLNAGGALDEPITWPEDGNILPELERRLIQKNKTVMITVKEGWVTDIAPVSRLSDDVDEHPVQQAAQPTVPADPDEM